MAGAVGLREVRYGYDGAQPSAIRGIDDVQSLFHLRPGQVHRLLALRARLRGGAGHLRADHRGPRLRLRWSRRQDEPFLDSECVSCGACVQACPTGDAAARRAVIEIGTARAVGGHHLRLLRRRLLLQGGDARRRGRAHGAVQGRQGQSRPFLRQGPLRLGLRHPQGPHPQADDPRQDHRSVARGVAGRRRSATPPREFKRIQAKYGRDSVGGITSSRCTNEETFLVQKLVRAAFGNNNVDTCARVCHSPTGYGLKTTFGTSAGTQDFDSVEHADVIMVIGANPTDAHPVFASRMKKRLRQGAQADRHRSAPDRPGAHAACRGGLSPAAAARHQRRRAHRAGACRSSPKGWSTRPSSASAATGTSSRTGRAFVAEERNQPGGGREDHRRAGGDDPRRGAALRHRRQRRDLLRPRRHRAQPGLDHGDGASPTSPWRPATSAAPASA